MKPKYLTLFAAIIFTLVGVSSCSKNNESSDPGPFLGRWKSNVGDTITFWQRNGQNICDAGAGNPGPDYHEIEFSYRKNKLSFKDGAADPGQFRRLETFQWIQQGSSFKVHGNDLYAYFSSTSVYFTFSKIP